MKPPCDEHQTEAQEPKSQERGFETEAKGRKIKHQTLGWEADEQEHRNSGPGNKANNSYKNSYHLLTVGVPVSTLVALGNHL